MPVNLRFPTGSSGTDTSDATAVAADMLLGKTAYANNVKLTGTIPTATTEQCIFFPGVLPGRLEGPIYVPEGIVVSGDENLVPEHIQAGVTIFGVVGTYTGSSVTEFTLFSNENRAAALSEYGDSIYMQQLNPQSGGPAIKLSTLSKLVPLYPGLCSATNNYAIALQPTLGFGWNSHQQWCSTTPITTDDTKTTDGHVRISTGASATMVYKLVRATGTGAELAANIMTNSQAASMFVDLATFTPLTGTNVVNIYNKTPPELTDGTYYLYWETSTDNFCPSIHQLYISAF
jgi:hypothetical protein